MAFTTLINLINTLLTQQGSQDKITGAELRQALLELLDRVSKNIAPSLAIPFNRKCSYMGERSLTADDVFTIDGTDATADCGTVLELVADGVHTPNLNAFRKFNGSLDYLKDSGTVNTMIFWFSGKYYWYAIKREVTGAITPAAPTAFVVDDTLDTANWTNNPLFTALSDYEYTLDAGATVAGDVTEKPQSIGNVAKDPGQVGIRKKAAGINPASAWLFTADPYTVSSGMTLANAPWDQYREVMPNGNSNMIVVPGTPNKVSRIKDTPHVLGYPSAWDLYANNDPALMPELIDSAIDSHAAIRFASGNMLYNPVQTVVNLPIIRCGMMKAEQVPGATRLYFNDNGGLTIWNLGFNGGNTQYYAAGGGGIIATGHTLITTEWLWYWAMKLADQTFEIYFNNSLVASGTDTGGHTQNSGEKIGDGNAATFLYTLGGQIIGSTNVGLAAAGRTQVWNDVRAKFPTAYP